MDIKQFQKRINTLIHTNKESREEIALQIDFAYRTFLNWIYKNRIPNMESACNLAAALGVTVEYLVIAKDKKISENQMKRLLSHNTLALRISKLAGEILNQSRKRKPARTPIALGSRDAAVTNALGGVSLKAKLHY